LRIDDVFISLQAEAEIQESPISEVTHKELAKRNTRIYFGEYEQKSLRHLSLNQALAERSRLVVLGDPGSGKTTLLKYIALAYAEDKPERLGLQEKRLPIFVRLYDYAAKRAESGSTGLSIIDYLYKFACDHLQLHLPPEFFEEELEHGRCYICLDGLDELGGAGLRREINATVMSLVNRYPRNFYIVTSRIVGYEEVPLDKGLFTHHKILPFSDEDIKLFVEKWYRAREQDLVIRSERTKHLINTVMNEPRIKSLATNPLMLTIIALVHRIEAELPHERVKLYDKCVTTLVETWDRVRGLKYNMRRRLLEKLAYWMHSQPGEGGRVREVREGTLELQLRQMLQNDPKLQLDEDQIQQEIDDFLTLAKTRSGLLVERGEGIYSFSHLTFQEYLTACDIEKRLVHSVDAIWEEVQSHLHDPHWREVILLLLGALNRYEYHNTELVERILNSADEFEPVLHRNLFLAVRALADHIEVDIRLRDLVIENLLSLAGSTEPAGWDAITSLGFLQYDTKVANGLLTLLVDDGLDVSTCNVVVRALGQVGCIDEILLNELKALANGVEVKPWMRNESVGALTQIRIEALEALAKLKEENEARESLLMLAKDEKIDDGGRCLALWALGRVGYSEETGLSELLTLASDERVDGDVRYVALELIVQFGHIDKASNLLVTLAKDKNADDYARVAAAELFGKLENLQDSKILLVGLASDERINEWARRNAAVALREFGFIKEATKLLLALVSDDRIEAFSRSSIAEELNLIMIDDGVTPNELLKLAEDENTDAEVRSAVACVLGQQGYIQKVMKLLLILASDKNGEDDARFNAAKVLGSFGSPDEGKRLLLILAGNENVHESVRINALEVVGQLG
jgi:energy-coupling factor transporter ATP-binding protein EcfA2